MNGLTILVIAIFVGLAGMAGALLFVVHDMNKDNNDAQK